jgi:hypothetical protein
MWIRGRLPLEILAFNNGNGSGGNSGNSSDTGGGDGNGTGGGSGTGDEKEGKVEGDGKTEDKEGAKPQGKVLTEDEVKAIVLEKQAQWQRGQEKRDSDAKRAAEEAALTEKEEFKTLAEKRGTRVAELEPKVSELEAKTEGLTAELDRANKALTKTLAAQKVGLTKPVLSLLEKMPPVDQIEWLAENGAEVRKEATAAVPNHGQSGAGNNGAGTGTASYGQTFLQGRYGPRGGTDKK